ncbi:MAG: alpha/beta hydrolase [Muribaculaceae bacterium]|nr:alpha/beta hydrolase [Muribaculaceae bacterium]
MKGWIFSLVATVALVAQAQWQRVVPLYDGDAPGNRDDIAVQEFLRPNEDSIYKMVSNPRLVIYRPPADIDRHRGIVVCPGGSYNSVCYGYEGRRVALALAQRGFTSLVLIYRVPDDAIELDKSIAPLQDLQQAIRYAREHAGDLGYDPNRLGVMGFSAGGNLVSNALVHHDHVLIDNPAGTSLRPDYGVLVYPVITFDDGIAHKESFVNLAGIQGRVPADKALLLSTERQVTAGTPPTLLLHGTADTLVPVQNSIVFYQAMLAHGRPVEMHLYDGANHGFFGYPALHQWLDDVDRFVDHILR